MDFFCTQTDTHTWIGVALVLVNLGALAGGVLMAMRAPKGGWEDE